MRQVVIDTETTGLEVRDGHRIIEFACIELSARARTGKTLHHYVNPEREVERGALEVHGIDNDFLATKPRFADVAESLYEFIEDSELIIHNASFDLGFLDYEFQNARRDFPEIRSVCKVVDTLEIARDQRPGRRNSLDALANEFSIDLSERTLHGAMQDAEILVEVYLALTGGQTAIDFGLLVDIGAKAVLQRPDKKRTAPANIVVIRASEDELRLHEKILDNLDEHCDKGSVWRRYLKSSKSNKNIKTETNNINLN